MKNIYIIIVIILSLTINISVTQAAPAVGYGFTYQGELIDSGTPANGDYDIRLDLYLVLTGDSSITSLTFNTVTVTNGLFTIDDVDFGSAVYADQNQFYIEVAVQVAGGTGFDILSPRQRLQAVPYAIQAEYLATPGASNGDVLQFDGNDWVAGAVTVSSPWTDNGTSVSYSPKVGIGTNSPNYPLDVQSSSASVAGFNGTNNSSVYFTENNAPRGYIGSRDTTANDEDFQIGTAFSNFDGDLHLTIRYEPKLTIIENTGRVGVGTTSPSDRLHVNSETGEDALRVQVNGLTKLRVRANGGVAVGSNFGSTPDNGLYVQGDVKQNENSQGMLKYMIRANCDATPSIIQSYNGTNLVGNITISRASIGDCTIVVPSSNITANYISVSARSNVPGNGRIVTCVPFLNGVICKVTNESGVDVDGDFDVMVF